MSDETLKADDGMIVLVVFIFAGTLRSEIKFQTPEMILEVMIDPVTVRSPPIPTLLRVYNVVSAKSAHGFPVMLENVIAALPCIEALGTDTGPVNRNPPLAVTEPFTATLPPTTLFPVLVTPPTTDSPFDNKVEPMTFN